MVSGTSAGWLVGAGTGLDQNCDCTADRRDTGLKGAKGHGTRVEHSSRSVSWKRYQGREKGRGVECTGERTGHRSNSARQAIPGRRRGRESWEERRGCRNGGREVGDHAHWG